MIDEDRKMTNSKNNIILIGMPGSGKSTNGVILAKNMGMDFIDSDILIQHVKGMRLEELLNIHGPEGFNVIEEEVNAAIDVENTVIATGGSVVYGEKAMENLKAQGTVVYLDITCKELEERLGDLRERGVSIKDGWTLQDLYDERKPLYEKYADITINVSGLTVGESMELIKSHFVSGE